MNTEGRPELVVDLSEKTFLHEDDFWKALRKPCRLSTGFADSLSAWDDEYTHGEVSPFLDRHYLVLTVKSAGIFTGDTYMRRGLDKTFAKAPQRGEIRYV